MYQSPPTFKLNGTEIFISQAFSKTESGTFKIKDGNVLRRFCPHHGNCNDCPSKRSPYQYPQEGCPDMNLRAFLDNISPSAQNIQTHRTLIVTVGQNGIDFTDSTDLSNTSRYDQRPLGWFKTGMFDAYFTNSGIALGGRFADCIFTVVTFPRGEYGFIHLSRNNMSGPTNAKFRFNDKEVGAFEYYLKTAAAHYQYQPTDAHVRVCSMLRPEHYSWSFESKDKMEELFPGWGQMQHIYNCTNPSWNFHDDPVIPTDKFQPNMPKMVSFQILASGIKPENIIWHNVISPADGQGHASNHLEKLHLQPKARDLYLIIGPEAA